MTGFPSWWRLARHRKLTAPTAGGGTDPPPDVGVQAARAFDFWDGVGVNTHITDGGANAYADPAAVIEYLQRLNFRHIRDGTIGRNTSSINRANQFGAAGIMLNLIVLKPLQPRPTHWPTQLMDYWFTNGLNIAYVDTWEGANEQNLPAHNGLPANGYTEAQWAEATRDHQTELFTTTRPAAGRPVAWRRPVVGWSYGNPNSAGPTSRMVACSTVADWDALCDIGCIHKYVPENTSSGLTPLTNVRTYIYNDLTKPMYVTETGYVTLMTRPTSHTPTPEDAAAWYAVKNPFVWHKAGVKRAYFYELLDESPDTPTAANQAYFGLCRYKAPGDAGLFVSKPHGEAIGNLLGIYKDPAGASYAAGKLDYTITASAPNLSIALHQRSTDNAFLMALYRDVKLFNRTGSVDPFGTYPTVADVNVTIDLGKVFATVEHRRPSAVAGAGGGPTLVSTATNVSTVTVPVGKHLSVLVIK